MTFGTVVLCALVGACGHKPSAAALQATVDRWPQDSVYTTHPDIVLVGDSIIQGWPRIGALNHGLGGQTMIEVAYYINADALVYKPRAVLIEGGINDLRRGTAVDDVIQARFRALRAAESAGVKVYFGNLIPFGPGSQCSGLSQADVSTINSFLASLCADRVRCVIVDFNAQFGGAYNPANYQAGDCLHPNAAGNALLDQAFNAAVASSPY